MAEKAMEMVVQVALIVGVVLIIIILQRGCQDMNQHQLEKRRIEVEGYRGQ